MYALCRPPGHHAGRDLCGGYCFLNNAAIAAEYLIRNAAGATCAILDIDIHHGNGTQQIFYERNDVLFVSIHASPDYQYPFFMGYANECGAGPGEGYNLNLPLAAGVGDREYLLVLDQALRAIADFAPRFLVISAGFDTFAGDPVAGHGSGFALSAAVYPQIGRQHVRIFVERCMDIQRQPERIADTHQLIMRQHKVRWRKISPCQIGHKIVAERKATEETRCSERLVFIDYDCMFEQRPRLLFNPGKTVASPRHQFNCDPHASECNPITRTLPVRPRLSACKMQEIGGRHPRAWQAHADQATVVLLV